MKTKLLILTLMFLTSGILYAQQGGNQGQRGQRGQRQTTEERVKAQADSLKKNLALTDQQYDSVKVISLKYAKKSEEAFAKSREANNRNMTEFQKIQEEQNQELKKVLTEEQYKKYEEQNKNRRGRRPEGAQRQR
ncbi:MAG: hypothetical protein LBR10_06020 [Prevotellaceae bacterium]|jgi:hypothetical protein|nr:hypothetical protein [Prevotellaceae bacterium]